HATGKAQHGNFLVAIKQEKGESTRTSGEKPHSEEEPVKKRGWPKGKKRKKILPNGPKAPVTGYVLNTLLNGHSHKVRPWQVHPCVGTLRHAAVLGSSQAGCQLGQGHRLCFWAPPSCGSRGRAQASLRPVPPVRKSGARIPSGGLSPAQRVPSCPQAGECSDTFSTFDVPIFTEEFLDQNKAREAELRRLRKMNTEFEEQNAILQKHTESMNCAKEKLEQELAQEERQTLALQQQLQSVRQALTASFASLPIPGTGETPTLSTLDFYMAKLHSAIESNPLQHEKLVVRIKEILSRIA
ncbi:HM20B regulator, partial [Centropus unirufus]|nr:HM20B regulator [Centropus unirufus]